MSDVIADLRAGPVCADCTGHLIDVQAAWNERRAAGARVDADAYARAESALLVRQDAARRHLDAAH